MTRLAQRIVLLGCVLVGGLASGAAAQVLAPPGTPITYGHHHLNVSDIDAHRRFWIGTLGGESLKSPGGTQMVRFPGVIVFLREQKPTGGTKGTTVNHVGFQVPNLRATVDTLKAAGLPIVTAAEVTTVKVEGDIAFIPNQNATVAFVMGPDDTKVEIFENKAMTMPIAMHHVHFAAKDVPAVAAWYARIFNGTPGRAGSFETVELPGASLRWGAPTAEPPLATTGRAVDHIGFEIVGLEAFCKRLQAMGMKLATPYTPITGSTMAIAFIIDPVGTSIELTENLKEFGK